MLAPKFEIHAVREMVTSRLQTVIKKAAGGTVEISLAPAGTRGNQKNTLIADVQAQRGRNPWYLTPDQRNAITEKILKRTGQADIFADQRLFVTIGHLMRDSVLANLKQQRDKTGQVFAPLTAAYAKEKKRAVGFTKPILVRTGDLSKNLVVKIERKGT